MQPDNKMMLRGQRVQLVPFCSKYWENIAKWFYDTDYKEFFRQFTRTLTEDDFKVYDKLIQAEVFIIHSLKDNNIMGFLQLVPCSKKNKAGYLGLLIDKSSQDIRISNEVTYLILDYLFNRQGYNKVIIEILESNEGLRKTLEKTGFYKEGKLLQECFMDGKFCNELRYSMSAYYFNKNKDNFLKGYNLWVESLNQQHS